MSHWDLSVSKKKTISAILKKTNCFLTSSMKFKLNVKLYFEFNVRNGHLHANLGNSSTRQKISTFARTRQTRRHLPSCVAWTRQTHQHSPSHVTRTCQTRQHLPSSVAQTRQTRERRVWQVLREFGEFGKFSECRLDRLISIKYV
jgi:hypothetical protein